MLTFDEIAEILDEVAEEVPQEFYENLNGGISLLPEVKFHEADVAGNLYTLGEYHKDQMGRYIVIYYGSFVRSYPGYTREQAHAELLRILLHEFTHHMESQAGERGLEYKDAERIAEYKRDWEDD